MSVRFEGQVVQLLPFVHVRQLALQGWQDELTPSS